MKQNPVYIWSQANRQPFIENINLTKVQAIISLLNNCNEDSQEIDINEIVLSINHIWQDSAGKFFNKRREILSSENISIRKPVYNKWFNETCKTSRICICIRSSKIYKKSISAAKLKARWQCENDLRTLKSTDPRKYWKMLNIKSLKRVGDEYHFLLECPESQEMRNEFLPHFFKNNPNMYKYQQLMSSQDGKVIIKLFKFIKGWFNHLQLYI